jgi:hypothetical protein
MELLPRQASAEAARFEEGAAEDRSHHQIVAVGACASETLVLSTFTLGGALG